MQSASVNVATRARPRNPCHVPTFIALVRATSHAQSVGCGTGGQARSQPASGNNPTRQNFVAVGLVDFVRDERDQSIKIKIEERQERSRHEQAHQDTRGKAQATYHFERTTTPIHTEQNSLAIPSPAPSPSFHPSQSQCNKQLHPFHSPSTSKQQANKRWRNSLRTTRRCLPRGADSSPAKS
jgi:hypothetical protein